MTQTPGQVWAELPAQTKIGLTARRNSTGLWHLAGHLGIIGALAIYVAIGGPFWWAALLPLGVALTFLFTLQHECTHQTPFATVWLNEAIGQLTALILLQPFYWFRAFHMAHHRHTNDPGKDPELQGEPKPDTWRAMAWHLSTVGYWADKVQVLWANAKGRLDPTYVGAKACRRIVWESRALIALYAGAGLFTLIVSPILIWIWLLPLALGFPILRLYLLAEHGRCPPVANMFLNSRTTLTTRAVRFLAWNMPYHAEHHAYPQVPFHHLPQLHQIIAPHLGTVSNGYTTFAKETADHLKAEL